MVVTIPRTGDEAGNEEESVIEGRNAVVTR